MGHILGIIQIINENNKKKEKVMIKSSDIEFLLRICYTNQISNAFEKLEHKKQTANHDYNSFIYILFSKCLSDIKKASIQIERYKKKEEEKDGRKREGINTLIGMHQGKKAYILKHFFNKELNDVKDVFFIKDDIKFQKFLIERAAIALR